MVKQTIQDTFEDVVEGLKSQAQHTGKALVKEPLNIAKELLGETGSDEKAPSTSGGQQGANTQISQMKQKDEAIGMQKLARLRQQMQYVQRQRAETAKVQAEKQQEEEKEEEEKQKKEQQEILQLQKEEDKQSVLQKNIKAMEGTKESGPRKQF